MERGGSFLGTVIVLVYYVLGMAFFWWSLRVLFWFFTGGDFPLPWQPFD